jgi:hypothetical protein
MHFQEGERIIKALQPGDEGKVEMEMMLLKQRGYSSDIMRLVVKDIIDGEGEATTLVGEQWKDITIRRLVWETKLVKTYPTLAVLAARLLSQHGTVCSTERCWSQVCMLQCSAGGL